MKEEARCQHCDDILSVMHMKKSKFGLIIVLKSYINMYSIYSTVCIHTFI